MVGKIAGIYNYYPRVENWQNLKVLKTYSSQFNYTPRWWVQQNPHTWYGKGMKNPKTKFWEITHYPQDYKDVNYTWNRKSIRVTRPRLGQTV